MTERILGDQELREQIADICRKGNAGIAETKVVDALYQLVVESQENILYQAVGASKLGMDMTEWATHMLAELQSQLSSIGGKHE